MIHDFLIVWRERDLLISGLSNTIVLSVVSTVAALLLGGFAGGFIARAVPLAASLWIGSLRPRLKN
jgi:polar amino acid transport system permease protein